MCGQDEVGVWVGSFVTQDERGLASGRLGWGAGRRQEDTVDWAGERAGCAGAGPPLGDRVWVGWDVGLVEYQCECGRKGIAKCLVHLRMKQIYLRRIRKAGSASGLVSRSATLSSLRTGCKAKTP